jgi:hypothetical protein
MNNFGDWAISLAIAGVLLNFWSSVQNSRAAHLMTSVFRGRLYSRRDQRAIRACVRKQVLPDEARLRGPSVVWAREVAQFSRAGVPWRCLQYVTVLLILCAFYGFDSLIRVGLALQVIVVIVGAGAIPREYRMADYAKSYLGLFEAEVLADNKIDDA